MNQALSTATLQRENKVFAGTAGTSQYNSTAGFLPAFYDTHTGRAELARFANGRPSPIHVLDGVPEDWVLERANNGRVKTVKETVVAGFLLEECFLTREQAANYLI